MHLLAISPHLDDAVFSAGGTLWERARSGDRITILTCFTGNVADPQGFALACQLDKGLGPEVDYMALRRAEDERACLEIGAEALHLPLLEAPHRGYDNAAALFGERLADDAVLPDLIAALEQAGADLQTDHIFAPFGIGYHIDHLIVREAVEAVFAGLPISWWEDYPYAMREAAPPPQITRHPLSARAAERKLAATLAYKSQLGFQFGGAEKAAEALAGWQVEGFTAPFRPGLS